jgi:hypothetical protein
MDATSRLCLAFCRNSEMLGSGIFLLLKDYLMGLRWMTPAGSVLPSAGTARCSDYVLNFLILFLKELPVSHEI